MELRRSQWLDETSQMPNSGSVCQYVVLGPRRGRSDVDRRVQGLFVTLMLSPAVDMTGDSADFRGERLNGGPAGAPSTLN